MNPEATYSIINEQCPQAYSESIPDIIRQEKGIVHFEMYNVWLAINIWGKQWKNNMIRIHCDNEVVNRVLNTYGTKDAFHMSHVSGISCYY